MTASTPSSEAGTTVESEMIANLEELDAEGTLAQNQDEGSNVTQSERIYERILRRVTGRAFPIHGRAVADLVRHLAQATRERLSQIGRLVNDERKNVVVLAVSCLAVVY